MSKVTYLQQRLDDLRERECLAKVHNRELLQQFDEAQKTLREVLNRTAAMKMLRKEYNIGSYSDWNHQLSHKTQTAEENMFGERQQRKARTNQLADSHDQLMPWPTQTETMPKQLPSCLSETTEDNSHSEDLDVKPVRLFSDKAGSKTSSRASSKGSTDKRKSNQSSSDEDQFISHKSLPSREVSIGSKTMAFISESEDAKTFSNQKSKYINKLGFKDTNKKDNGSESHSEGDKSDVDKSSVKLSQKTQENGQLKKFPKLKEKYQILSDQSSLQDEDDNSEKAQTETSQEDDGEMSNQDFPESSSVEAANHETVISGSTSSAESESYKCDGSGNNMKLREFNQDTALGPEDSDSEDCIVSPQTRSKIIHVIPEHVVKHHDEESKSKQTSSDDDNLDSSSDEEGIEHVLAPQEQTRKQREPKADKSEELCESDDFYD